MNAAYRPRWSAAEAADGVADQLAPMTRQMTAIMIALCWPIQSRSRSDPVGPVAESEEHHDRRRAHLVTRPCLAARGGGRDERLTCRWAAPSGRPGGSGSKLGARSCNLPVVRPCAECRARSCGSTLVARAPPAAAGQLALTGINLPRTVRCPLHKHCQSCRRHVNNRRQGTRPNRWSSLVPVLHMFRTGELTLPGVVGGGSRPGSGHWPQANKTQCSPPRAASSRSASVTIAPCLPTWRRPARLTRSACTTGSSRRTAHGIAGSNQDAASARRGTDIPASCTGSGPG